MMVEMKLNKNIVNVELDAIVAAVTRAGRSYRVFAASWTSAEKEQIVSNYLQAKEAREQAEKERMSVKNKMGQKQGVQKSGLSKSKRKIFLPKRQKEEQKNSTICWYRSSKWTTHAGR